MFKIGHFTFSKSESTKKNKVLHLTSKVPEVKGGHEFQKFPKCKSDTPFNVNSVQDREACAKYFAVHLLKFEILQTT